MTMKRCHKCGVEKTLCEFNKNMGEKDGLQNRCRVCSKAYFKAYHAANKEKIKAYRAANKEKIAEQNKTYNKAYYQANKDNIHAQRNKRMATDPAFKMKKRISNGVRKALKNQGSTKSGSTFSALPYTPQDLVEHLEKQFDEKMNWDNYGTYWHLDHIYPQSLLPYDNLAHPNFQKCWALDNLQPLEAIENLKKGNREL